MVDHCTVTVFEDVVRFTLVLSLPKIKIPLQTLTIHCCELELSPPLLLHFVQSAAKTLTTMRGVS